MLLEVHTQKLTSFFCSSNFILRYVLPLRPIVVEDRVALLLSTLGRDPTSLASAFVKDVVIFVVGAPSSAAGWDDLLFSEVY
jgi:hypothetical protein